MPKRKAARNPSRRTQGARSAARRLPEKTAVPSSQPARLRADCDFYIVALGAVFRASRKTVGRAKKSRCRIYSARATVRNAGRIPQRPGRACSLNK